MYMQEKWKIVKKAAGICLVSSFLCYPATAGAMSAASAALHKEAVQLARDGDYAKSLQIMRQLEFEQETDEGYWADYLVILSWAGQEKQLVLLADKHYQGDFSQVPEYALKPLAQAYEKAGRMVQANDLYKRFQITNPQNEYQAAYERGLRSLGLKDYVAAEQSFGQARQLAMDTGDKGEHFIEDMDARRAAIYIHQGEYDRAVIILQTYVKAGSENMRMLSDYLMALHFDNKDKEAEQVFNQLCKDWSKMPVYGLQTMGDLYLRIGKYRQAHTVYSYILQKMDVDYVRLGDAYALAMMGHDQAAVLQYADAVKRYPDRQAVVAADAVTFLQQGRLGLSRKLFNLLGGTSADREKWQLQYGQQLVNVNVDLDNNRLNFQRDERLDGRSFYHEANEVLKPLLISSDMQIKQSAAAAFAQNQLNKGLFAATDKQLAVLLDSEAADDPNVMAVSSQNERRQGTTINSYYRAQLDNKRNHETDTGIAYTGYLGSNLYALAGYGFSWLQDDQTYAQYTHSDAGVSWHYERGQIDATYDHFGQLGGFNGYAVSMSYEPNDAGIFTFAIGHRPHANAGAVDHHVAENYHMLSWEQILNNRWRFGSDYEWDNLSDGNEYWSYGVNLVKAMSQRHNYRDNLLFDYSYGHYDQQTDIYDSPYRRVDYGLGMSRKWNFPGHDRTWEWTNMLEWGHDNNEGLGFSPYSRLEWSQTFRAGQALTVGAQYTWYFHQIAADNESRRSNGYIFDFNYSLGW